MKLKIKESKDREAITVQSIVDVNQAMITILKSSYRNLSGLNNHSRIPEFKIYAKDFKSGSLEQIYEVVKDKALETSLQLSFAAMNFDLQHVYETGKMAIEAIKNISSLKKEGKDPTVNIQTGDNSPVYILSGSTLNISQPIFDTMKDISSAGESLTAPLRRGDVDYISLDANSNSPVILNDNDKDCFSIQHEIDTTPVIITGNIYKFNKDKKTGSIVYVDSSQLKKVVKFKLINDSILNSIIDSMKKTTCSLVCLQEFINGPKGEKNIISLMVLKVN